VNGTAWVSDAGEWSVAYERHGRGAPRYLFAHANGFCKETWHPVIAALGSPPAVSIDQPGHGASEAPPFPFDWWDFGRAVLAVVADVDARSSVGVGHSSGGTAVVMAEVLEPGTFERLVLVEPIVFPPPHIRRDDHPLVAGALRRTTTFASADAAADSYRGRGPFARWEEGALQAYVHHGFAQTADGWTLRCRPGVEAEVYATAGAHDAWDRLGEIGCPVDIVVGEDSDTHHGPYLTALHQRFRSAELRVITGATHFVPMEQPTALSTVIAST
jgi:pimeloyl-ACP methyl ester carboxylesterase